MPYNFKVSPQFKRDVKVMKRRHRDMTPLKEAIGALAVNDTDLLAGSYRDHKLTGGLSGYRELHIEGDWLLVYKKQKSTVTIVLMRTGTHDQLF
ncbi:type II toxin-antitoxin system YafQ family toxin [Bifidobacterium sp. ESL0769]|uniref:type II toxin-antitoxin system RelE/ParE family toxin n=1 Tax=Bifidobacterium sp. ESL0769 TaxID=2983229 RepID=UPI0023F893F5|nr:type II toxin-antitoxin system YafQ family toxin [Bifidobacterium sp. ESL0769]WEV67579.1 type II toxin-antitoxin system YafQ family toxin [Bifidobacterium sp. ESL0769]